MSDEHEPEESGECVKRGYASRDDPYSLKRSKQMKSDVEEYGEVHATFENESKEVEIRLGTSRFNFHNGVVEIWDGDNYEPFSMDHLVSWYKPMEVYH